MGCIASKTATPIHPLRIYLADMPGNEYACDAGVVYVPSLWYITLIYIYKCT